MAADQPLRDISTLIIDAGMRPEEVFRMTWENLHLQPTGASWMEGPAPRQQGLSRNPSHADRVAVGSTV